MPKRVSDPKDKKVIFLARFGAVLVTVICWLKIFISPTLVGVIVGGLAFLFLDRIGT